MNRQKPATSLADMIAEGEHEHQDFKYGITDSRKIARSLVAFANTDGGRLLIGIKDNGAIVGVKSEEEFYMIDSAASIFSIPEIHFSSQVHRENGKTVLEIWVPPSIKKPHYVKEASDRLEAYYRYQDQNIHASAVRIAVWNKERIQSGNLVRITDAEASLFELLQTQSRITLEQFISYSGLDADSATDTLANLIVFGNITANLDDGIEFFEFPREDSQLF